MINMTPAGWSVERVQALNDALGAVDAAMTVRQVMATLNVTDAASVQVRTDLENLAKTLLLKVRDMA